MHQQTAQRPDQGLVADQQEIALAALVEETEHLARIVVGVNQGAVPTGSTRPSASRTSSAVCWART